MPEATPASPLRLRHYHHHHRRSRLVLDRGPLSIGRPLQHRDAIRLGKRQVLPQPEKMIRTSAPAGVSAFRGVTARKVPIAATSATTKKSATQALRRTGSLRR
ncbi:MAG TPA: hypothetical protein VGO88_07930 [Mycetocola sp.]|nr:hypothetical protein [Mycetocola sp.]